MRPLFFEGVSAITFANVALCGLGIHTSQCHVWRYFVQKCWCACGTCSVLLYVIRSHGWSLLHSYCVFFCDELHTTKITEALVDKWWLAWWKPPTCDSLTELVIVLVLKTATCRTVWFRDKNTIPTGFLEDICTRVWLTWSFLVCAVVMFSVSLQRTTMIYELFPWTDG